MALIECKNLCLAYGKKTVAKDINFTLNTGDYLCIIGENGSGKSTLLKAILGIIPKSGGRLLFGDGLTSRDIGYLPQQAELYDDFPASVFEVIISGMAQRKKLKFFYSKTDKKEAETVMKRLNILNLKKQCYCELSGGQKQRVLLARAICAAKKLIVLDEPTSNLDPNSSEEFYKIISELNKEKNIAIIMVSHDIDSATKNAEKILNLSCEKNIF